MPKLIVIPLDAIATLITCPGFARVSPDNTNIAVVIDNALHILEGDFENANSAEEVNEKIQQYLS